MSIEQIQEEISRELALLNGDAEMITFYMIAMGQKAEGMDPADRKNEHIIKGCHSRVWLKASLKENRIHFSFDSNTMITKGLGSLLIRLFNGQYPEDIITSEVNFIYNRGLRRFIGSQRMLGFEALIGKMKVVAANFVKTVP